MFPIQDSIPRRCPPLMTWTLISINLFVFFIEAQLPEPIVANLFYLFGLVPARFTHPEWSSWSGIPGDTLWPFLTSLFLHGGWIHVFGNMWTLWIFGDNVEDEMGPLRFLFFYVVCGVASGVVHAITNPVSTIPTVGASGAVAGVMGAYYVLFPRARIVLMVPIFFFPFFFEVTAFFYLAFWFLQQIFSGALSVAIPQTAGGIAWWAHIGGFVCGAATHKLLVHRPRRRCRRYRDEYRPWGLSRPSDRL